jgi:hypothetical protein
MLETADWGCTTYFADGTKYGATPHAWDHHYHVIAHRCGYEGDTLRYCIEHELAHLVAEECLFDRPSRILWGLAHGEPLSAPESAYEEMMAQRFSGSSAALSGRLSAVSTGMRCGAGSRGGAMTRLFRLLQSLLATRERLLR